MEARRRVTGERVVVRQRELDCGRRTRGRGRGVDMPAVGGVMGRGVGGGRVCWSGCRGAERRGRGGEVGVWRGSISQLGILLRQTKRAPAPHVHICARAILVGAHPAPGPAVVQPYNS